MIIIRLSLSLSFTKVSYFPLMSESICSICCSFTFCYKHLHQQLCLLQLMQQQERNKLLLLPFCTLFIYSPPILLYIYKNILAFYKRIVKSYDEICILFLIFCLAIDKIPNTIIIVATDVMGCWNEKI